MDENKISFTKVSRKKIFRMYRNDNRIILDKSGSVEDAQNKIKTLVKDLHLTICKINRINKGNIQKLYKTNLNLFFFRNWTSDRRFGKDSKNSYQRI